MGLVKYLLDLATKSTAEDALKFGPGLSITFPKEFADWIDAHPQEYEAMCRRIEEEATLEAEGAGWKRRKAICDLHFALLDTIEQEWKRYRAGVPGAREAVVVACERQIKIARLFARAWRHEDRRLYLVSKDLDGKVTSIRHIDPWTVKLDMQKQANDGFPYSPGYRPSARMVNFNLRPGMGWVSEATGAVIPFCEGTQAPNFTVAMRPPKERENEIVEEDESGSDGLPPLPGHAGFYRSR